MSSEYEKENEAAANAFLDGRRAECKFRRKVMRAGDYVFKETYIGGINDFSKFHVVDGISLSAFCRKLTIMARE